tara:strand:+ start:45 stop:191 length:147 start_codon:yes stop_codon:yes gene_type:complete
MEDTFIIWVAGEQVYKGNDKKLALDIEKSWKDNGYKYVEFDSFWDWKK